MNLSPDGERMLVRPAENTGPRRARNQPRPEGAFLAPRCLGNLKASLLTVTVLGDPGPEAACGLGGRPRSR
jgi:hypothetical protein